MKIVSRGFVVGIVGNTDFIIGVGIDFAVDIHGECLATPFAGEGVVFAILHAERCVAGLCIVGVVAPCVVAPVAGAVHVSLGVVACGPAIDMTHFEDVNLAALRPWICADVFAEHPESRP